MSEMGQAAPRGTESLKRAASPVPAHNKRKIKNIHKSNNRTEKEASLEADPTQRTHQRATRPWLDIGRMVIILIDPNIRYALSCRLQAAPLAPEVFDEAVRPRRPPKDTTGLIH
jgi:hypothetical protein